MSKENYVSAAKALGKRVTNRSHQVRAHSRRLSSQNLLSRATLKDQVNKTSSGGTKSGGAPSAGRQVSSDPPTLEIGNEFRLDRAPSTIFDTVSSPHGSASVTPGRGGKNPMWASTPSHTATTGYARDIPTMQPMSSSVSSHTQVLSTVHLTKSGYSFYNIVKKCIQQVVRLLDNRLYVDLTKSVYPLVVESMQNLMIAYTDLIAYEIRDLAPVQVLLSQSRRGSVSNSKILDGRRRSNSNTRNSGLSRASSHRVTSGNPS